MSNNPQNILVFPFPQCKVIQINGSRFFWERTGRIITICSCQNTSRVLPLLLLPKWILDLSIDKGLGTVRHWVFLGWAPSASSSILWLLVLSSILVGCLFLVNLWTPCSTNHLHRSLWVKLHLVMLFRLFHELQSSSGFSGLTLYAFLQVHFPQLSSFFLCLLLGQLRTFLFYQHWLSFYRVLRTPLYTAENLPYLTGSLPGCEILSPKKTPQINEFFLMLFKSGPIDKAPS